MEIINKLQNQHKHEDIANIQKERTKFFDFLDILDESCKNASIALSSNDTKIKKLNKVCLWYSVNKNLSIATLQTNPLFPYREIESPESPITPLTKTFTSPKSNLLETAIIGQYSPSDLAFIDIVLKTANYTNFKLEIQTTIQETFNSEFEKFKIKPEKFECTEWKIYQLSKRNL